MERAPTSSRRIESLDQFRGYTVAGMILVNFIGGYAVVPAIFKHHNTYCSYADTIMPQFFFAVGFAYRLTMLRRIDRDGTRTAYTHALSRSLGLILLGFVIYHLDGGVKTWPELKSLGLLGFFQTAFQKELFQTLVHIALASLWVLPVIARSQMTRWIWLVGSAGLHLWLSATWYFEWLMARSVIDGGPLGFLSWSIPVLVGSMAYDVMASGRQGPMIRLGIGAIVLMGLGYALTCADGRPDAPPFFPPHEAVNLWTMCQRSGSVSYQTFAAGFSLAVYLLFAWICDFGGVRVGLFRTLGRNALAAYVLHELIAGAVKPYCPNDSPAWFLAIGFITSFGLTYLFIRHLEKGGIFLKL